jgi:aclacinomycin oxidase
MPLTRRQVLAVTNVTRRKLLAMGGVTAAATVVATPGEAIAADRHRRGGHACPPTPSPADVRPADPRYEDLATRGFNARFAARPESIRVVHDATQVAGAVRDAVRDGKRIAVRSGGHCFDALVDDPAVQLIIDMGEMDAVYFDAPRRAFAVEPGATLGQVYRTLFTNWGVTLPAGVCPSVGMGGHVAGGGYGPLSRRDGIVIDHLYAVEVVVVDAAGQARTVVATREAADPHRDLWWAHTGGGGGNFGVVTKYWFRSPGATGSDPARLLPRPPATLRKASASWTWNQLDEQKFSRLVRNHGAWHARVDSDPAYASLHSGFSLNQASFWQEGMGAITLDIAIDGTTGQADRLIDRYLAAVGEGVGLEPTVTRHDTAWMKAALTDAYQPGIYNRSKSKGAYLRRTWSDRQIAVVYEHLREPLYTGAVTVLLYSYGGKVNTVPTTATASPQRDSILKSWYSINWAGSDDDGANVDWLRRFYQAVHADTGGVPVPNDITDGSFINYPDVDLLDPTWNSSAVPWHELYYKQNYLRLQQVKARWDPRDVFRHPLSIRPPA